MRRVLAGLVLIVLAACGCSSSSESGQGAAPAPRGTGETTTTTASIVEGVTVETTQVSLPPGVTVPPATAPLPSANPVIWPRRGRGCRRSPLPRCSTGKHPCCRPGDPKNERLRVNNPLATH
jgi:hypothetical protein